MLTQDLPHNVKSSKQIYDYLNRIGLTKRFHYDNRISYRHGRFYNYKNQPISDLQMHGIAVEFLAKNLY